MFSLRFLKPEKKDENDIIGEINEEGQELTRKMKNA